MNVKKGTTIIFVALLGAGLLLPLGFSAPVAEESVTLAIGGMG